MILGVSRPDFYDPRVSRIALISSQAIRVCPARDTTDRALLEFFDHRTPARPPAARAMVIISPAVDDADPLAAANGARAPRPAPAANHFDSSAAWSLFDVVHGTTATADVAAGTTPWWSSQPPNYAASTTATSSGAYDISSSFPPPPSLQSHGDDLACYAGSIMDTSFPPLPAPPALYTQPELSYSYYLQEPFQSCFAAPLAVEPTTIRPQLQVPATETASMPLSSLHYSQTQQATTTGSESVEEASPALADTQQKARDETRPAPRRRGRPSKRERALAVSEPPVSKPTKRVAVGRTRAASSTSQTMTSSATTAGTATTMSSSAAGQVPEQAGGSSSSTGSTSDQQTAACTSTNRPMALLCEERRCQLQLQLQLPAVSSSSPAPAGVVVEGHRQQAAIAPPELMMVTAPQYADTSAVGVRFHPTDQQLIGYLRIKYAGQQMPVKFFKDFDVYQAHPMAIKGRRRRRRPTSIDLC